MLVLAVIPARGGSKSIPKKNIKPLYGKPLIEYTIETALESGALDRIAVSTDQEEIISVCKKYEGIHIIHRPPELATDEAPTEWALLHACDELKGKEGFVPDIILTLEPTSPLRRLDTISRCVEIFETTEAESVIGVVELSHYPGVIKSNQFQFIVDGSRRRRQDREPVYMESSTIYGTRHSFLTSEKKILSDKPYALIVNKFEAIDINNQEDFDLAELLIKK